MKIVIIGPPGSGKSTQAKLLANYLRLPHLSTGDLSRMAREGSSELARRVRERVERGQLVADEDMMQLLERELSKPEYARGFVLDGFPRNIWQTQHAPFRADRVFYLEVSDQESVRRLLKRGREDDQEAVVQQRLADYHQLTEPVLDYYRQRGVLEKIDGEGSIERIFEDIKARVGGEHGS